MVEAVALVPVARLGVARGVALSIAEQRRHAIVGTWFCLCKRTHTLGGGGSKRAGYRGAPCGGVPLVQAVPTIQLQFALKHASSQ